MSQTVTLRHSYKVNPDKVFKFFTTHDQLGRAMTGGVKRIKTGNTSPDGVGSVRRMGAGALAFEETVMVYDAPKRQEYKVTKGSPIKNHLGVVTFTPSTGGGTDVEWRITFDPKIPLTGGLIAAALKIGIAGAMKKIEAML